MLSGLRVLLRCVQVSPRPCFWQHPLDRQTRQRLSDLEVVASNTTAGTYVCYCQEGGPREQPPCKRAEYHLTLAGPSAGGNMALAGSGRHFLAWYVLLFILGMVAGAVAILCLLMRQRRGGMGFAVKGAGHGASMSEKRHDILASSATPQSPSSASLLSEAVPLTKRNGTLNGHGGGHNGSGLNHHLVGVGAGGSGGGGHNGPHVYSNNSSSSDDVKLSESSSKLGLQHNPHHHPGLEGRERPGTEGEEGEGLSEGLSEIGEGLSGLEEELAGLQAYRGAPLAQCEESSI